MKKLFVFFIFITLVFFVYSKPNEKFLSQSVSIADFSLQYKKNGRYYNYYDNPARLFEILGEEFKFNSTTCKFDSCFFHIRSRNFEVVKIDVGLLRQVEDDFGIKEPNYYYAVDYLEIYKDFKTIREIGIGDDIKDVIKKYPEATLYKNNKKYKWEACDCYSEKKIENTKKLSDIGYVLLETANWQYNRSYEVDLAMHYELVFIIKDNKVKSIVMQFVNDAI